MNGSSMSITIETNLSNPIIAPQSSNPEIKQVILPNP